MLKGNHDLWWATNSKMEKYFNDAIIGNKNLKATFSKKGELLRINYPNKDYKQFVDYFKVGLKINDSAFENNILLAGEELGYRINLYDRNYSLVGVANRAHVIENFITLGEVILFDNKTNISNLNIEIVLNNETIIKIIDLEQNAVSGDSIKYCRYSTSRAKIKLETGEYDSTKMKLKGLKLPDINASVIGLNEELTSKNDVNALVKAFKQNKRMNIVKIDINKYLLG